MLILSESPAGYGLFSVKNKKLMAMDPADIEKEFATAEQAQGNVDLVKFMKFKDTKAAMEETTALIEGKMGKSLKKFLKKNIVDTGLSDELFVIDKALGANIKEKLEIPIASGEQMKTMMRGLRMNLVSLVEGLDQKEMNQMALGLSHSMSRFKLKFSPDKVDTMIIQAIGLLDDLDKELNNMAMRLREWYGWHFPEMSKIITDGLMYCKCVKLMGMKENCKKTEFSEIGLPEDLEEELKKAAEVSMGTEITQEDLDEILSVSERVRELTEYRHSLDEYLRVRMEAIAPNLTHLVGYLVGARLISHAGSLMNLAKHPASTIQVLGAEKALFRALKSKTNTPKYGLIYHAKVVGGTNQKFKGKISRVLAAKMALSIRVDALGEESEPTVAIGLKDYIEKKISCFEEGGTIEASRKHLKGANNASATAAAAALANAEKEKAYNTEADGAAPVKKEKKKRKQVEEEEAAVVEAAEEAPKKKKKKVKMPVVEVVAEEV